MTHEWDGEGGILEQQEAELQRMAGDNYSKREACKMAAWIKPKLAHKHMMSKLLQVKAHLILTFRAEEKIEMAKVDGKLQVRKKETLIGKDGWVPICEKNVPFEATCSFLLLASNPGKPHPIKLQEQHKPFFKPDQCIDEQAGQQLAKWAIGGSKPLPKGAEMLAKIEERQGDNGLSGADAELQAALTSGLQSKDAPATFDDPSTPWKAKVNTAHDRATVNKIYKECPDELKQDIYATYSAKLKELKG